MKSLLNCGAGVVLLAVIGAQAFGEEGKKTRDELVRDDRSELQDSDHWIYNDLEKAFGAAESSGKPLMVVHRCIP